MSCCKPYFPVLWSSLSLCLSLPPLTALPGFRSFFFPQLVRSFCRVDVSARFFLSFVFLSPSLKSPRSQVSP